jgi:hypothetical protein
MEHTNYMAHAPNRRFWLYGLNFIDALLNGIELPFQPLGLGLEVNGFLLRCERHPTRDAGGIKATSPAASHPSAPKTESAAESEGWIGETGPVVPAAVAHAEPGSRTGAQRTCVVSSWHSSHLLSVL